MEIVQTIQNMLSQNEGALITGDANRRYVTGFSSSAGTVLITKSTATFLIDFRYFEKAKSVVKSCDVVLAKGGFGQITETLQKEGATSLLVEREGLSLAAATRLQTALRDIALSDSNLLDDTLQTARSKKSAEEIAKIKLAQQMTDQTFDYILPRITPGRTQQEVLLDMEFYMRSLGSAGVSFDFIVLSGKDTSLPHGVASDKKIQKGDFVTMDFGAVVDGYRSDMTRTVAVGCVNDEQKRVYDTVLQAKNMAMKEVSPGKICKDIDAVARDFIHGNGYEGCFGHGLGHSVGLEIHENPCFNTSCMTALEPGMIITVEPGIYLENQFGVRIEDMVLVTKDGFENLTHSPDELIIL